MIRSLVLLAGALLLSVASAQTSTVAEPVPSGTPLPGYYAGPLRPQVHYSPPQGFMNDPNGMFIDVDGLYHLYYQFNPTGLVAGNVHWGHATSEDLYTWTNQKIALFPDRPGEQIFSGSAVLDPNNTSGFFPNQTNGVVAIYTLSTGSGQEQVQEIAYSYDNGYTFTKYAGNPVISAGAKEFRDPKAFWHEETESWVVLVAFSQEFVISIYTSPNLIDWTFASNFSNAGLIGLQYECPNLLQMPMEGSHEPMWLLYISINPGAPYGGSIGEYFPGHFNGTHFTAVDAVARIADFGKDNYAAQFFYGIPANENQISIAWASNWQYTNNVPTDSENFRSVMSLPRYNYLTNATRIGYQLVSVPYNIESIFEAQLVSNDSLGNGTVFVDYSSIESGALYFEANVTGLSDMASLQGSVNFTFSSSVSGESVRGGTDLLSGTTWVDRGETRGFDNPYFTDKFSNSAVYDGSGLWRISGVIDRSIIEVFVNGGEESATNTFYPNSPLDTMALSARGLMRLRMLRWRFGA
ncbi:Invertase [Coniosporium tulheliwenetii]|uniref:Invertase n=1 Tax=Coniosporium tulheliwenetii TaxID=3383036 RepID=A0ACC2ZMI6_9PEZI|nr:Invertase [Cladosporium sp. JES 115]